jgi:hypothetical protein
MYNSIAPTELVSHMKPPFAGLFLTDDDDRRATAPGPARRLLSAALRALANRLEPMPAAH